FVIQKRSKTSGVVTINTKNFRPLFLCRFWCELIIIFDQIRAAVGAGFLGLAVFADKNDGRIQFF
ncbi:hypothetical protein, partial [Lacticaseibacillus yichunensis]